MLTTWQFFQFLMVTVVLPLIIIRLVTMLEVRATIRKMEELRKSREQ
jgi:hypothetical protein